jgi:hypothetical protein
MRVFSEGRVFQGSLTSGLSESRWGGSVSLRDMRSGPRAGRRLSPETYSVPQQTEKLFREGILQNPLISKILPPEALKYGGKIRFVGSNLPSIPINWRLAESISTLKGLEATMLNVLLTKKYGVEPQEVIINTFVPLSSISYD